jgi:hypothetical protein
MALIAAQQRTAIGQTGLRESQGASATIKSCPRAAAMVIAVILLVAFFLLQRRIPLGTAVQIGADEGFEVAKATLCLHGHKLYSEVWNDQPPLHTWLVTQVLKHLTPAIWGPRLLTAAFAAILLVCVFVIVCRACGLLTGALTGALVVASPGFLELSSSCMLEIPALATAIAGLGVLLVLPRTKWYGAEFLSGVLFGIAALMKLVPLYLLPLAALILWLRRGGEGNHETHETHERGSTCWFSFRVFRVFRGYPLPSCAYWRGLVAPLLVLGGGAITGFTLIDWLMERGAYLAHFQQSWSSHFGGAISFEYGSPAEHPFDWSILLKNWDVTVPAVLGICIVIRRLRTSPRASLPLAWLVLALVVFTNHKPWWSYYYVHIAIPLCWCAAVGIDSVYSMLAKQRLRGFVRAERKRGKAGGRAGWRALARNGSVVLFALCAVVWMGARVYLQIAGIRESPQLYTALVLPEIERLKPFSHWMYTDQLVYSFHADIPMPPPLAVVPLKRLWTGDMTSARIAAEMSRFKPEVILLRNATREVPFQELLQTNYRMIYQDDKLRLYADRATIKRADLAQGGVVRRPQSVDDSK